MINLTNWKTGSRAVTNILLDPYNARIPDTSRTHSQPHIMAELVEHDKVYELAKSIVENGYYPIESLLLFKEKNNTYVLEGNRRLAALKLLLAPEAAPSVAWAGRFGSLAIRIDPHFLEKVNVVFAPSREAAAPIIMSRHTRSQVMEWSPLMQAKFYHNLVDGGQYIDDIAEQYKIRPQEITDALQRYTLYAVACSLDLPEKIDQKVQNPRNFPITTLDRLFVFPETSQFLGISFDQNNQLVGSIHVDEFKKGYTKIVTDVAKQKEVTSRTLNTKDKIMDYLSKFGDRKPNLERRGKFTADGIIKAAGKTGIVLKKTKPSRKKPKSKTKSIGLIPKEVPCDVDNQRIIAVFDELKRIPVGKNPNAVGITFRCLIEMSLGHFLDRSGHLAIITKNERDKLNKKNRKLPRDWHPALSEMLTYVIKEETGIIQNANLRTAIDKLRTKKDNLFSINTLNLFVHNQHFYPEEDTLRNFWQTLEPLFKILLVESITKVKPK